MPASPEAKRLKVQEEPVMKDVTEVDEALLEISQPTSHRCAPRKPSSSTPRSPGADACRKT